MAQNIKRVPKGDPSSRGGEFAKHKRDDAGTDVGLTSETYDREAKFGPDREGFEEKFSLDEMNSGKSLDGVVNR